MNQQRKVPKQRILTAALLLALAAPVGAQESTPEAKDAPTDTATEAAKQKSDADKSKPTELEAVVVTGIAFSLESSVAAKRNSNEIVEVVTAEDMGKLPDASVAEALARLPGLTGQRGADGRVTTVSIRGLSPAFSGALLNGRQIVSSNDGRAVEYDQFPAELIGSAVVYKTPNAALMGQGLSGTVDLIGRRPLDTRERVTAASVLFGENSLDTQVPGVTNSTAQRFSASYVDQFADNTFGVALGIAYLDSPTQLQVTELDQYGDYSPYGLPLDGIPPSLYNASSLEGWGQSKAMLPMFWTGLQSSKENTRTGVMAVFEYQPNEDVHSQLDLYYSKFDTHEVGGKFTENMFASWGQFFGVGVLNTLSDVGTTQVGQNTFATTALASNLPTTTTNFDTERKDTIWAVGWNTSFKMSEEWTGIVDLSYSHDSRDEKYQEIYAGPWNNQSNNWAYGAFSWNVPVNGDNQSFRPVDPGFLSDPNAMRFGDVTGFDYVVDPRWTGVIRDPHVDDKLSGIRLAAKRSFDGWISSFEGGVNYTKRDKSNEKNENRLLMRLDGEGNPIGDVPTGGVLTPFDMSWMGISEMMRLDVPYLVNSGTFEIKPAELRLKANDSSVHEKILTAYAMANIDTLLGETPIRGNFGLQYVHTDQNSEGWTYRGLEDSGDLDLLFKADGGTSYGDFLPTLNLVAELPDNMYIRFGAGVTTARPEINDLRAGRSNPTVDLKPGPEQGRWSTSYAGNPELKPWKASYFDLSVEKYFGNRSYVSAALFRKNLINYITYGISAIDNSDIPLPPEAEGIPIEQFGPVFQPLNGAGGTVSGIEVAVSLDASLISESLDGFGMIFSAANIDSTIRDQKVDQNSGQVIAGSETSINGLSGVSNNVTFYYEKHGFSGRISQRYRSPFTATTRDIFFRPTTRQQGSDKIVDMQFDYAFSDASSLKGLSLLLQFNNLTDSKTTSYKSIGNLDVPDAAQLVPNYTYHFGRQILFGASYKF